MQLIDLKEQEEQVAFAKEAAAFFAKNPDKHTMTRKEVVPGCLFALRWGAGDDCVAVIKLDDFHQPVIYQQLITQEVT